ncbi:hypothetical protein ACSFA3_08100 [Variovorax sp. RHLX14]|uniref:hypothetical protein n=1 Tax=Variovorax sp. RHLX14 TaxID=1259731 RepID=UPI003F450301
MTVICETCQTANRDKAMFCIGCAGKLPAFAATGPAALAATEGMRRQRRDGGSGKVSPEHRDSGRHVLQWWFAVVLLLGGVAAALVGWIALTPGRTASTVAMPSAAASALPAPSASSATPTSTADAVPFESALSPGEMSVAAGKPTAAPVDGISTSTSASLPDNVQAPAQRPSSARVQMSRNSGGGRADPRTGCEHLFFAFAARCEANHCAEAAYARHPRCDVVRAERQRDDARRNMTSGY